MCFENFTPRIRTRHFDNDARDFRLFTRPFPTLGLKIFRRSSLKLNIICTSPYDHSIRTNLGLSVLFKLVLIHLYLFPILFAIIVDDFSRLFDRVITGFTGATPL